MKERSLDLKRIKELIELIDTLRGENGCPWDRKQTLDNTKAYILEETYELIEAIEEKDIAKIKEELADVIFQCIFIARILEDEYNESLSGIIEKNISKMTGRHPHIFSDADFKDEKELLENWEYAKKSENKGNLSIFSNIVKNLPALLFAQKVQEKASRVGFDWENADGPAEKIKEEIDEFNFEKKLDKTGGKRLEEELGDILFSIVNLSRFYQIDSELALRLSIKKFIKRFYRMETLIQEDKRELKDLSQDEMDEYWEKSKKMLRENIE